jgi:site-specific recombinase XerD
MIKNKMTHHTLQSITRDIEEINKILNKEKIEYKIKVSPFLKRKRLLKKYLYNKMKNGNTKKG